MIFKEKANDIISKLKVSSKKNHVMLLNLVVSEVSLLVKSLETKEEISPSFPKVIVDSWDFDDDLGSELLELYQLYKRIISK
ncbi:hypothetical protein [Streptococcus suis]|uniref:Phage protein n=1 Tax=Streptococcus suis TaxID=1307 RepID=A0A0Z8MEK1_STRSU|nr:hypothetical protein [Streptococcus suis]MDW8711038.1 hypothetical protein [Streptococcus suis]NQG68964.1 hypothetical protein [Streptococcus suis]NQH00587.1 hypothetical protein [Streptococcus suis]NQH28524.1 hypothetical protein [Streptococcus suis]NQH32623.1 hypothetical protein [Streptococcus suis]